MNKIKISDSDKRLLIIFFAIVILACSYFFIFNKGMTKASELEAQNEQDSAKVQQMQQMEASLPQVKENIGRGFIISYEADAGGHYCEVSVRYDDGENHRIAAGL